MAAVWSTEQIVAEYGDLQASAMAVDCLGTWAVLAGRRALTLVDLSNPSEKIMKHPRHSKWDISCVQWNPHPSHANSFVTACNQRIDLFSRSEGGCSHKSSMKGHSRTVSDVDWSPFDVNIIASCSVDTFTHLWDVRDPRKPQASFQTVAGASQVMWNRAKNNLFATTHEGDVRIWDPRKGSNAIQYIAAHLSKIHGLDWRPDTEDQLATASQDGSIKFWDIANPRQSKGIINPGFPVWRARYTPFGHGLVTVTVPQLRRGDNSLYLWNVESENQGPVHQFIGHHDVILEFQWRKQPRDEKVFELVTWSKDQSLRIWKIDPQHQRLCGHDTGDDALDIGALSMRNGSSSYDGSAEFEDKDLTHLSSSSPDNYPVQVPRTLQQEFSLVNIEIPNLHVEEMNPNTRTCIVLAMTSTHSIRLKMLFPAGYPNNEAPSFEFMHSTVSGKVQQRIIKVLTDTSQRHVRRNTNCLEPCLRQLAGTLDHLLTEERRTPDSDIPAGLSYAVQTNLMQMNQLFYTSFIQDHNIPFPRTSGARFCAAGFLVVFGRAREAKKARSGADFTPKALSDLTEYATRARIRPHQAAPPYHQLNFARSPPSSAADSLTIKSYYYRTDQRQPKTPKSRQSLKKIIREKSEEKEAEKSKTKPKIGPVKVYDSTYLLPINKYLGETYKIDKTDIPGMCSHNAKMAANVGRKDLVELWSLVALMADSKLTPSMSPNDGIPWGKHPLGRKLLQRMMEFYSSYYDVQTLAMLCCLFWNKHETQKRIQQSSSMDYIPLGMEPSYFPSYFLGSSTDSGWNVLPLHPTSLSPLSEVASHPNLAALYQSAAMKLKRSSSWANELDSFEDYRFDDEKDIRQRELEREQIQHSNNCRMLDIGGQCQYDQFLRSYADILYHWGYKNQSTHILKFASVVPETHKGIEFGLNCHRCRKEVRGPQCGSCKVLAFSCVICHIGVRGASNFCLTCGHGGHSNHMLDWFQIFDECPTGCGCKCTKGKTYITMSDNT